MFKDFDAGINETSENVESAELENAEDLEPVALEDEISESVENAVLQELTPEESAALEDTVTDNIQQMMEQYAMDDQEVLAALEARADATATMEDDGQNSLRTEFGKPCDKGCSGSTWCYGCGDLK